jgi:tetratricopeptide (TPR) repeat protein
MGTRTIRTVFVFAMLSGCATAVPELSAPPDGLSWVPNTPFRDHAKADIPADAIAVGHFLKGQLLLGEADFDGALKEFEAAVGANSNDAFLRFRLASLYLRKGDMRKALSEAEAAVKLDSKTVENHLLLAGL